MYFLMFLIGGCVTATAVLFCVLKIECDIIHHYWDIFIRDLTCWHIFSSFRCVCDNTVKVACCSVPHIFWQKRSKGDCLVSVCSYSTFSLTGSMNCVGDEKILIFFEFLSVLFIFMCGKSTLVQKLDHAIQFELKSLVICYLHCWLNILLYLLSPFPSSPSHVLSHFLSVFLSLSLYLSLYLSFSLSLSPSSPRRAWTSRGELDPSRDCKAVAVAILAERAQQASMHGYPSYACYATADTMAGEILYDVI